MNVRLETWHRFRLIRSQAIRRSVNTTIPILERLRPHGQPLPDRAETYLDLACEATGLYDFGYPGLATGLAELLGSVIQDANLSYIGRKGFYHDTLRLLENTLWLTEERRRIPSIGDIAVTAPVFIMGLPRTASTFLQSLLIEDPGHRAPEVWEATFPHLNIKRGHDGYTRQRMQRALLWLNVLEPDFQSAYPVHAESPQECSEILSNVFESLRFDTVYDVPAYLQWMDDHPHQQAYHFHRWFLQHLYHHHGGGRWILKCPDHVFFFKDIIQVYPDARFIITHRDPAKVIPSVAALTMILQGLFSYHTDASRVAQRVFDRWVTGSRHVIEIAKSTHAAQGRVLHVFYDELTADPVGTLARIYAFLDSELTPTIVARVRKYLGKSETGEYRMNRYTDRFEKLLPAPLIRDRFHDYLDYFGMETEHPATGSMPV